MANKLPLNTSKTEYMIVGSRQKLGKIDDETDIKLGDIKIKKVSETKLYVLLSMTNSIKWNSLINIIRYRNDSTNEIFLTSINPDFCIQFNYLVLL